MSVTEPVMMRRPEASDDTHRDDLWYVVMQAITPDQYDDIAKLSQKYCDLWVEFWDAQMSLLADLSSCHPTVEGR